MDEAKRALVQSWMIKAQHDLAADPELYLDTAIYHCQQAAEKAIKGFFVFHDQRFEKTHDIRLLIILATSLEERLSSWLDAGERLTPYAHIFRYPGEVIEPNREEFDQALQAADGFYRFVLSLLPQEVRP